MYPVNRRGAEPSPVFTDIVAAIEEARFLKSETGLDHKVIQRLELMYVKMCGSYDYELRTPKMFTTKTDRLTGGKLPMIVRVRRNKRKSGNNTGFRINLPSTWRF